RAFFHCDESRQLENSNTSAPFIRVNCALRHCSHASVIEEIVANADKSLKAKFCGKDRAR
ncbi:MAG: hypothetical protein WBD97_03230, partial [Pseudolabrys sp.]